MYTVGDGYTCSRCGQFVLSNTAHECKTYWGDGHVDSSGNITFNYVPPSREEVAEQFVKSLCSRLGLRILDTLEIDGDKTTRTFMILNDEVILYKLELADAVLAPYQDIVDNLLDIGANALIKELNAV
jgi:hypothetical protein